jgi:hypothetical protein
MLVLRKSARRSWSSFACSDSAVSARNTVELVSSEGANCDCYVKSGLANFNPLKGHTIRKDSPEGRTYVYKYRKWNTTFVLLLFVTFAMLCSADLLGFLNCITETVVVTEGRMLSSPALNNCITETVVVTEGRMLASPARSE